MAYGNTGLNATIKAKQQIKANIRCQLQSHLNVSPLLKYIYTAVLIYLINLYNHPHKTPRWYNTGKQLYLGVSQK